jgi:hypothetical protein
MRSALLITLLIIAEKPGVDERLAAAKAELSKIAEAYEICFYAEPKFPLGEIDGKIADKKELATYTQLFIREFIVYPPELLKKAKVKQVVFCKDLSFMGQKRAAIPDLAHDTLYLDVSRGAGMNRYQSEAFHHDLFHMIDYYERSLTYSDERWSSLNRAGFQYGPGGAVAGRLGWNGVLTDSYPGFLTQYSLSAVEEDKAEIFSHLLVNPAYVEGRIKKDAVLRAKVQLLKERLAKFCPDINDAFWEKAKKIKRDK